MSERWNLATLELLGQGGESIVYALDDRRVLRLYKPGIPLDYLQRRAAFYDRLREQRLPFELPDVLEHGTDGDRFYTIEPRMRGRPFAEVLPGLSGDARHRALASYLDVTEAIGMVELPGPFGELLTAGEPLQRPTWSGYLWDRLQDAYHRSRTDLEQDVPAVERVLEHTRVEILALEDFDQRRLVHGDYFPGNVFIADEVICGVIDFSYATVIGDPRMDIAGAIIFLEVVDGYRAEDTALLTRLVDERHGDTMRHTIDLYRRYYSFFFSTCKLDDRRTYAWCARNLRTWLESHSRDEP